MPSADDNFKDALSEPFAQKEPDNKREQEPKQGSAKTGSILSSQEGKVVASGKTDKASQPTCECHHRKIDDKASKEHRPDKPTTDESKDSKKLKLDSGEKELPKPNEKQGAIMANTTPNPGSTQQEPPKRDQAKQEPTKQEPPKQEAAKQEPPKQEAAKQEPAKQEPPKQEAAKQEPAKQEPAKQEQIITGSNQQQQSATSCTNCCPIHCRSPQASQSPADNDDRDRDDYRRDGFDEEDDDQMDEPARSPVSPRRQPRANQYNQRRRQTRPAQKVQRRRSRNQRGRKR